MKIGSALAEKGERENDLDICASADGVYRGTGMAVLGLADTGRV